MKQAEQVAQGAQSFKDIMNEDGSLKFDFFFKIFKLAWTWSDAGFDSLRNSYILRRRAIFDKEDPDSLSKYFKLCMLVKVQEEDYFYKYLKQILEKIGSILEEDFQYQI